MAEKTGIAWTDHTFNPWWGCTNVSLGCDNCYAERDARRFAAGKVLWGVNAERRTFGDKHWLDPVKWNIASRAVRLQTGVRHRVFCASMADVFDNHETAALERPRLWQLIRETPFLDWQLLTKRIGNAKAMLPADWGDGYRNVWLGASIVNQPEADRDIPKLLAIPAAVRFLSCEPLLGPLEFSNVTRRSDAVKVLGQRALSGIDWVIVGGESGPGARSFNIEWARSIVAQCRAAEVAVFVKQLGAKPFLHKHTTFSQSTPGVHISVEQLEVDTSIALQHRKGEDPAEWPADLRVQEFPLNAR